MDTISPRKVAPVSTKYRTIKTDIPSPGTIKIIEDLKKLGPFHSKLPVAWEHAENFQVFDPDGNCWIDFTSGIVLANSGHSNLFVSGAIKDQVDKQLLHAYNYPTEVRVKFLEKLIELSKPYCEAATLFSSGSEATECMLITMRANGYRQSEKKVGVISFQNAMHGVTMGAQMLRGHKKVLPFYGYKDPNIFHLPFPATWNEDADVDWAKKFNDDITALIQRGMDVKNLCGIIMESFQGWSASFYPQSYIDELVKFAKRNEILIAVDEIQGGCGRTGKMFAFEHYGMKPDLIALGKGLSSSLPLSAVLGSRELLDLAKELDVEHSTHSYNPVACAAGLANLLFIDKLPLRFIGTVGNLLASAVDSSIKKRFPDHIISASTHGLLCGIVMRDISVASVAYRAMEKGVLVTPTSRGSIKITPPLTIPVAPLFEGIEVIASAIDEELSCFKGGE